MFQNDFLGSGDPKTDISDDNSKSIICTTTRLFLDNHLINWNEIYQAPCCRWRDCQAGSTRGLCCSWWTWGWSPERTSCRPSVWAWRATPLFLLSGSLQTSIQLNIVWFNTGRTWSDQKVLNVSSSLQPSLCHRYQVYNFSSSFEGKPYSSSKAPCSYCGLPKTYYVIYCLHNVYS